MNNIRILVIEDDPDLNEQLCELLASREYRVDKSFDGEEGLCKALENSYDMILLDVLLPNRNGLSVLSVLRSRLETPVILVTAKGAEEERIMGLSKGADDYISKPFHPDELLLRIQAIFRRCRTHTHQNAPSVVRLDELEVNQHQQSVSVHGKSLDLTPIQFKLLNSLMQNQGEVLSKAFLYQTVLNKNFGAHDRSLDMHLSRVRRRLSDANWNGERLQTVHGKGYCLS